MIIDLDDYQSRIGQLSDLLKKRAASHPIRDDNYTRLMNAVGEFTEYLLDTTDFRGFQPNREKISETEKFVSNPIFVCGLERSGTTLLLQLLDSHPNLLVWPVDGYYFRDIDKWNDRNQFANISRYWVQRLISPTGKEPFWLLGKDHSVFEVFLQHLKFFLENSDYDIFVCVILAIYVANDSTSRRIKYWVEKSTLNELRVPMIIEKYPKAKFIHIIRDPLTNMPSYKQYVLQIRNENFSSYKVAQLTKKLFRTARINQKRLGSDQYHIVKYEDLTAKPTETMTALSDFLNIPFNESLLIPTENGCSSISNSMYQEARVRGKILDQSKTKRYKEELTHDDLDNITTQLYYEAKHFDYDLQLQPRLRTVLHNRMQKIIPEEKTMEVWHYTLKPFLKNLKKIVAK